MVNLAEMLARKDPELAERYGFQPVSAPARPTPAGAVVQGRSDNDAVLRVRGARDRQARRHPSHRLRLRDRAPREARAIAQRIGGPTVIKSQVLSGGRMKAGGVKFADTPEQAEAHAREILALEINGHMPRGVLVDPVARSSRSTTPASSGTAAQAAGDDLLPRRRDRHRAGRRGAARARSGVGTSRTSSRSRDFEAKEVIASTGVTGSRAEQARPDPYPAGEAVRRARHDPRRDQPARAPGGRLLRRAGRAYGDRERGARPPRQATRRARRRRGRDPSGARGHPVRAWPARRSTPRTTAASPAT